MPAFGAAELSAAYHRVTDAGAFAHSETYMFTMQTIEMQKTDAYACSTTPYHLACTICVLTAHVTHFGPSTTFYYLTCT